MKDIIYILGHKNPDTDSICSAIAYAEFKNKISGKTAIPVRLGEVNRETEFILNHFDVEKPELIKTVKVQVSDLNIDNIAPVSPAISLKMAWSIMKKYNTKTLPVVDNSDKLIGIVSISDLASIFMDVWNSDVLSKSNTSLENILDTLSAKCIYSPSSKLNMKGKVIVVAMHPESSKEILEEGDIAICGDREDTQSMILDGKASLMIVTGSFGVNEEILAKAKENCCSIITTPYDSFTAARLVLQSIPVDYVMRSSNLISFKQDDFVDDIKDIMLQTRYRSYPVVDGDGKVVGSISRYHLISANKKKVILVDHNEKSQSVNDLEQADLMEIIDHHRVGDIQTGRPIYFRNEPVGSTSTIVASMFFENGIRPSKKVAGILCSAIISDTLDLKSPTSTNIDKLMLERLTSIAGIDEKAFAKEIFKAGTLLEGKTVEEIFYQDFKSFKLSGKTIGISQVGTMDIEGFRTMKNDMVSLMERKATEDNYNALVLMLTDILNEGSKIIVAGKDKELIAKAFNVKLEDNCVYLPGILSRKKQVVPVITAAIEASK